MHASVTSFMYVAEYVCGPYHTCAYVCIYILWLDVYTLVLVHYMGGKFLHEFNDGGMCVLTLCVCVCVCVCVLHRVKVFVHLRKELFVSGSRVSQAILKLALKQWFLGLEEYATCPVYMCLCLYFKCLCALKY